MKSTTEIESPVMEEIRLRRSKRAFADRTVAPEKIRSLFEAARWAPSSMNEQPWTYVYATAEQSTLRAGILSALNPTNQLWAQQAPLFIVSLARRYFSRNQMMNHAAYYDLGSANAFLSLQATHEGLIVHQIGGFDQARLRDILKVPDDLDVMVVMVVGYPGDPEALPENLRQRELAPRQRLAQTEFVRHTPFE